MEKVPSARLSLCLSRLRRARSLGSMGRSSRDGDDSVLAYAIALDDGVETDIADNRGGYLVACWAVAVPKEPSFGLELAAHRHSL